MEIQDTKKPKKERKPTHHDITRFRVAKMIAHARRWNELIGKSEHIGRRC